MCACVGGPVRNFLHKLMRGSFGSSLGRRPSSGSGHPHPWGNKVEPSCRGPMARCGGRRDPEPRAWVGFAFPPLTYRTHLLYHRLIFPNITGCHLQGARPEDFFLISGAPVIGD